MYRPYPDCDQQARPLDLAHVRDADIVVSLEAADDAPAGADDAHVAVGAAEEEAIGAGADAGDLVAVEEGARLVVVGELDLADIEEVEGFPLRRRGAGSASWLQQWCPGPDGVNTYREGHAVPYRCLGDNDTDASRIVVRVRDGGGRGGGCVRAAGRETVTTS